MAYGNINVDTVTTSTAGGVLGAGNASIMKNRLINGGCVIDQRNAGASVTPTDGQYTLDRWSIRVSQASKLTTQQNQGSVTPPVGFTKYLGVTSSSAYSIISSDYFSVRQCIEGYNIADLGWGTANAKTVTLSFQAYSSLTGTFGGAIREGGSGTASYPFTYSIPVANTWTLISVTIAGPTIGTWNSTNGNSIELNFGLGCGTAQSGTAGAWSSSAYFSATGATSVVATNGATFYITGVQLEVGTSATGFEYRQYGQELALCQRYLPVTSTGTNATNILANGFVYNASNLNVSTPFLVTPRVAPTGISVTGTTTCFSNQPSGNYTLSSITYTGASTTLGLLVCAASGATSGQPCNILNNDGVNNPTKILWTGCEL